MPAHPIFIRPIDKADLEMLFAVDQKCFPRGVSYSRWELKWFTSRRGAFGYVAELCAARVVSVNRKQIVGFILAWKETNKAGHIITLDVLEPFRRRAIGSLLMKKVEDEFRRDRVRMAVLEVAVNNTPAFEFYKKFGYEVSERLRNYYPTGDDAFEMLRWFDS
jgi:ribosomal-protein-alanine N-acetyltransferase